MKLSKILSLVFGIIILILIIKGIGINDLINVLKKFNLLYLPLIIILLMLDYILGGINTWIIARGFKKISLFYIIKATFITLVYAVILPGKLADLLIIPFLRRKKLNLSQSTISIGLDKIISLIVKAIFGLFGAIFILKRFNFIFIGIPLIALFIMLLTTMLAYSKKFKYLIKTYLLGKYSFLFKGFSKNLRYYIKRNKKYLYYNLLITIIKTFLEALLYFMLFLSFGELTNVFTIFFIFSLLSVIMLLTFPIGISGIGVREGLGIIVFGAVGVSSAVVFNSFILRLILIYLINFVTIIIYKEELNILKKTKIIKKFNL